MRTKRFAQARALSYARVIAHDPERPRDWAADFGRAAPLHVELGMGAGHHLVARASVEPEWNHLGVECKFFRVWQAARRAEAHALMPIRFLVADIEELAEAFDAGQVGRLTMLFPDPWPRPRQANLRLTHPRYLALYRRWLAPHGRFELRTDNEGLYRYSRETLREAGFILEEAVSWHRWRTAFEERYLAEGRLIYGCAAWMAAAAESPAT